MAAHSSNPRGTQEAEEEGALRVGGQPGLHGEFKAILNYKVRPKGL